MSVSRNQVIITKKGKKLPLDLPIASESQTGLLRKEDFALFKQGGGGGGSEPNLNQSIHIDFGTIADPSPNLHINFGTIV